MYINVISIKSMSLKWWTVSCWLMPEMLEFGCFITIKSQSPVHALSNAVVKDSDRFRTLAIRLLCQWMHLWWGFASWPDLDLKQNPRTSCFQWRWWGFTIRSKEDVNLSRLFHCHVFISLVFFAVFNLNHLKKKSMPLF